MTSLRFRRCAAGSTGSVQAGCPARTPLRTVRESFPSYGSSLSNRCSLVWARGGRPQPMCDASTWPVTLGRYDVSRSLVTAPLFRAAQFEVSGVVWVVGIGSPTDFNMALYSGAGGLIQGEHMALALFLGKPDAEEPFASG